MHISNIKIEFYQYKKMNIKYIIELYIFLLLINFVCSDIIPRTQQLYQCPDGYFSCDINYGSMCCPNDSFCGTNGQDYVCYT